MLSLFAVTRCHDIMHLYSAVDVLKKVRGLVLVFIKDHQSFPKCNNMILLVLNTKA